MKRVILSGRYVCFGVFSVIIFLSLVFALTINNNPGSCNGQWTSCSNAFADNVNKATASVTGSVNKSGIWNNYGFLINDSSKIDSVRVRADFFASKMSGRANVRVSGDGGLTYGPSHIIGGNTAEQTFWINVTNDLSWIGSKLSNGNLKVNVTCFKSGSGGNPTCNLDYVPVEVLYAPFDFSVSASPASGSVVQGNNISTTAVVNLLSGLSEQVNLSYFGCPSSSTCSFSTQSGNPSFNSTFRVATTLSSPTGTYNINITGTSASLSRTAVYTLTINPACIRGTPSVLIQPDSQSGTNGTTLIYSTRVNNTDSSACSSSIFSLSRGIPTGWSAFFNNNSFSLTPGTVKIVNFTITSNGSATSGNYTFNNTALNQNSGLSGLDNAIYSVF